MEHLGKNESKCKKEQYVGRKKIQKKSSLYFIQKKIALKDSVLFITNRNVTYLHQTLFVCEIIKLKSCFPSDINILKKSKNTRDKLKNIQR